MVIDIRGTQAKNKGAQLMLIAIAQKLGGEFPLAAKPAGDDYDARARLGLQQTLHVLKYPRLSSAAGDLVPAGVARRYGLVRNRDISGVLDAAGFGYTDAFGEKLAKREALFGRSWARRGIPKVMLPQAFGPFTDPQTRRWSVELLEQADLIFARDRASLAYLEGLALATPVRVAPDFTIGVKADPVKLPLSDPFVAIVPNFMLIRTGKIGREQYVKVLSEYVLDARRQGLEAMVVVHDESDATIAEDLASQLSVLSYASDSPLELKGALGMARAVVSSRYHAVVGGLSQGVPTLVLGWSHKYLELLNDFGVPHWLAELDHDPYGRVGALLADTEGLTTIASARPALEAAVDDMWESVRAVLRRS